MPPARRHPYRLESSLGYLVNRASRSLRRAWNAELRRRGWPITGEHFAILVHVWSRGPLRPMELAETLAKDRPAVTRLVGELVALRYVGASRNPGDGRQVRVALTPEGRCAMTRLTGLAAGILAAAQAGIPRGDLQVCRSVLGRIQENLARAGAGEALGGGARTHPSTARAGRRP